MKRDNRIRVLVTPEEKASIQSEANSIGLSVSRLLRGLGLRARHINSAIRSLRLAIARLMRLKILTKQRETIDSTEVTNAIEAVLEPLQTVEEALAQSQAEDRPHIKP